MGLRTRFAIIGFLIAAPLTVAAVTITENSSVTGNASIIGTISKGSGTFVIDHPLDPQNKLLYHSFVESPDVKNVYDGVVTLDEDGAAIVELPPYFFALNRDMRYLVSPMSGPMPNLYLSFPANRSFFGGHIRFGIAGGIPDGEVSWQVTGIRHDTFIRAYPIIVVVDKSENAFLKPGECVHEPLCE
jgi:hypothetical protein